MVRCTRDVAYLSPTPFVEVSHQVVEAVNHRGVLLLPLLDTFTSGSGAHLFPCPREQSFISLNRALDAITTKHTVRVGKKRSSVTEEAKRFVTIALEGSQNEGEHEMSADEGGESGDDEKTRVLSVVAEEGVHYDVKEEEGYTKD